MLGSGYNLIDFSQHKQFNKTMTLPLSMNEFQTFIKEKIYTQETLLDNEVILHFGHCQNEIEAAANGNILTDLSHQGLLKVTGDDTTQFLQGQVTNDVRLLDNQKSQFTGYCNPKGRLLALFFAFKHQGAVHLSFDSGLVEAIQKRLTMYVLRAKVNIENVSNTVRIGVAGAESEAQLKATFNVIPQHPHDIVAHEDTTIIRLPYIKPAFHIVTTAAQAINIWQTLSTTHTPTGKFAWDWLATQSAIPEITSNTKEAFVPQMINLDALDGINYKKGCYTGQEIVARTHYLGKVKRRTLLAHMTTDQSPIAGDIILDDAGQNIGQIVRVCPSLAQGFDVLFECRLEGVENSELFCNKTMLSLKKMPYQLEKV